MASAEAAPQEPVQATALENMTTPALTSLLSTDETQGVSSIKPMDSEQWFFNMAVQCRISKEVLSVVQKSYETASDFYDAFEEAEDTSDLEDVIKSVAVDPTTGLGLTETNWKRHNVSSRLRRFFRECAKVCKEGTAVIEHPAPPVITTPPAIQTPQSTVTQLITERLPPIRSISDVESLTKEFENMYPCEILTDEVTPARDYIRRVKHQTQTQGLEWMPWTHIVSKSQEQHQIKNKGISKRKRPMTEGAALLTLWEEDITMDESELSGRPHSIATTLATRSNDMAMLSLAHLGWLKNLDSRV